jgi:glycerol-3-phosphate cytidylyltransferase-like family protein
MSFFNLRSMHCPCSEWKGCKKLLLHIVHSHLIKNARDPSFQVWRGPGVRDSSDEEWKNSGRSMNQRPRIPLDSHVNTRDMVDDAFLEEPLSLEVEDIVQDIVMDAFALGDSVHAECSETSLEDEGPNLTNNDGSSDEDVYGQDESDGFDPALLEEAVQKLYDGSCSTKLAATILVMNLCTVYGVSNNFADELLNILHCHLLPKVNTLPRNHYAARTLTNKLGLAYNTIHTCG